MAQQNVSWELRPLHTLASSEGEAPELLVSPVLSSSLVSYPQALLLHTPATRVRAMENPSSHVVGSEARAATEM